MGEIISNTYELLGQLGQGGMGVVYKARHINFDETVAIKRLWEQYVSNEPVKNLFLNEGRILRRLHHRNIVKFSDLFEFEGSHYIVMEYIDGRSLSGIIKKETGPIRRERAINLFKQMLEGMAYVHSQNPPVIHRDIKPLNILVTSDDVVKITDFGIAKALNIGGHASTVVKGTPVYMSPEQIIAPSTVDIRTDVYSLGMTFYEMLCGKTPFASKQDTTPTAVYHEIMTDQVPPPTEFYPAISESLVNFVMKAIHKDREQRFADAKEMLKELERIEERGETLLSFQGNDSNSVRKISEPPIKTSKDKYLSSSSLFRASKNNGILKYSMIMVILIIISLLAVYVIPWNRDSIEMVEVEGGTFMMGTDDGETTEKAVHQVTVSSFLIGKYEITQAVWESVMGENPSTFNDPDRPVDRITWFQAIEFCNRLSDKEGLQKVYSDSGANIGFNIHADGYRLPTEAEWEYAARGGNSKKDKNHAGSNDLDDLGWYAGNTGMGTRNVGKKQPNELGIYDMSGNVWEWCWDWFGDYSSMPQENPSGPTFGSDRINRGGSWRDEATDCLATSRQSHNPEFADNSGGLRVVRKK